MVEYSVMLKRFQDPRRPDVCIFRDTDREKAIKAMWRYAEKNGFSICESDGRLTVATILLVERGTIAGAPVLSVTPYHKLFDNLGNRKK